MLRQQRHAGARLFDRAITAMDMDEQRLQSPSPAPVPKPGHICIYCREPGDAEALICKECGKWRSRLRNGLVFWSGFTGLVTFILTTFVFLANSAGSLDTRWRGADLQFRNVSSLKQISVANNSGDAVILGTITFAFPGKRTVQIIVDRAVAAGEVAVIDAGELIGKQTLSAHKYYFAPQYVGDFAHVGSQGGRDPATIIDDLDKADYQSFTVEALNVDGADYSLLKSQALLDQTIQVACQITVEYQVVRGGEFIESPECIGLVRDRPTPQALRENPIPSWLVEMIRSFNPRMAELVTKEP